MASAEFPLSGYYELTSTSCFEGGETKAVGETWRIVSNAAEVRTDVLMIGGSTPISEDRYLGWGGEKHWWSGERTDIYGGRYVVLGHKSR